MDFRLKCTVPTITSLSACNHLVLIFVFNRCNYVQGRSVVIGVASWVVIHQGNHTECNVDKYITLWGITK